MLPVSLTRPAPALEDDRDPGGLVGRVLDGRYRVTGLLGAGGLGRVYRAEHLVLRRAVAIKVLLEHFQYVPDLQRRFEREAMALAALSHPNIVTITDFVATKDLTFLVMELVEGEPLDAVLEREPLAVPDAMSVMEQILGSLAYAHGRDVIHRDLKPQNVMVRRLPGGRLHAEILDFGLAKFMDGSGPSANLTRTGLVVGTPAYMAPEQVSGAHANRRADVYAAGIMLFEMLTGTHPFEGSEGTELLRHHLLTTAPKLKQRCPDAQIDPALESLVARALAKDASDRYADGTTMLEAFLALPPNAFVPSARGQRVRAVQPSALADTRAASPAAVRASAPSPKPRRRGRLGWVLALLALGAAGAFGWQRYGASIEPMVQAATQSIAVPPVSERPDAIEREAPEPPVAEPAARVAFQPETPEPAAPEAVEAPEPAAETPSEEPVAVNRDPDARPTRRAAPDRRRGRASSTRARRGGSRRGDRGPRRDRRGPG